MREEIEAAALFITRLVNKNLSQPNSLSSSLHSHSSSASSASSTTSSTSDSPPGYDMDSTQQHPAASHHYHQQQQQLAAQGEFIDKTEQFRQCLTEALYERFHNHWFPDQPTKGQAYRCIRLNEWDRHDSTLQRACLKCGIDYDDLQLPVELTLWVDPNEVTCRFGENKGSHCLVAKFKDGQIQQDGSNFNLDIKLQNLHYLNPWPQLDLNSSYQSSW